jgi:hypothetical protein
VEDGGMDSFMILSTEFITPKTVIAQIGPEQICETFSTAFSKLLK